MNNNPILRVVGGSQPGYVYLVNAVGTNKFKIGKTRVPVSHRIDELQTGCPIRLRYVYHAYVYNMSRIEKELHNQFACFRSIGEWFSLNCASVQECITLMRLVQADQSFPLLPLEEEEEKEEEEEGTELEDLRSTAHPRTYRFFTPTLSESERAKRALQLKAKGWGKAKIILEVWGVSKGGSPKYKAAEAEYKRLVEE